MKTRNLIITAVVSMFALMTSVYAQEYAVRATIPFDFSIGQQTLPAGEYRVSVTLPGSVRVIRIGGHETVAFIAEPIRGVENVSPKLVFHCYGPQSFLAEVWAGETNTRHQLYASAGELEAARSVKPQTATILAKEVTKN